MKKVLIMVAAFAFLAACNNSKKGAWTDEDKQKAKDELTKIG
jgi:predicted small secreted protein